MPVTEKHDDKRREHQTYPDEIKWRIRASCGVDMHQLVLKDVEESQPAHPPPLWTKQKVWYPVVDAFRRRVAHDGVSRLFIWCTVFLLHDCPLPSSARFGPTHRSKDTTGGRGEADTRQRFRCLPELDGLADLRFSGRSGSRFFGLSAWCSTYMT